MNRGDRRAMEYRPSFGRTSKYGRTPNLQAIHETQMFPPVKRTDSSHSDTSTTLESWGSSQDRQPLTSLDESGYVLSYSKDLFDTQAQRQQQGNRQEPSTDTSLHSVQSTQASVSTRSTTRSRRSSTALPVDVDAFIPEDEQLFNVKSIEEIESDDEDCFILDELEYSRQLVGYCPGFEPENEGIAEYNAVHRDGADWSIYDREEKAPIAESFCVNCGGRSGLCKGGRFCI